MTVFIAIVGLFACTELPLPRLPVQTLSPADGQTSVSVGQSLRVSANFELPPGYPSDVVQVIDLESGGIVPGTIVSDRFGLTFEPDAPWLIDRDYLWTVRPALPETRQPEVRASAATATFATTNDLHVLGAFETGNLLYLLFSRPIEPNDLTRIQVTLDDEPTPLENPEVYSLSEFFDEGDAGLGGATAVVPFPADRVRVWVDNTSSLFLLDDRTIQDAVRERQQGTLQ